MSDLHAPFQSNDIKMLGAANPTVSHYINGESCFEIDTVTLYRSMPTSFSPMLGTFEGSCAAQGYHSSTGPYQMSEELVWNTYQKVASPQDYVSMMLI